MTGIARLASAMRRCRFGHAPWAPALLGTAVGVAAFVLSSEYFLDKAAAASGYYGGGERGGGGGRGGGRDKKKHDGGGDGSDDDKGDDDGSYDDVDDFDGGRSGGRGEIDMHSWLGGGGGGVRGVNSNGSGLDGGADPGTGWIGGEGGGLSAKGASAMKLGESHVMLLASALFAASEGAALAAALGTFGWHVALPAIIRGGPRTLAVAAPALAAAAAGGSSGWGGRGGGAGSAACSVALAALAEPLTLFACAGHGLLPPSSVGLETVAAAFLAAASLRMLFPSARRLHVQRANAGFAFGVMFAAIALVSLGTLCWQTSYCDRRW
mmetsp:Transcript_28086/g.69152  ORF Transcript_28086/g.69152 Transcript_28086/m.69152 type:complete len:324 (-) Transcript_28086:417-1388(-)